MQEYHYLTMPELLLAMNRLRSGAYGDFRGRLTTPRLMGAMREFIGNRSLLRLSGYKAGL